MGTNTIFDEVAQAQEREREREAHFLAIVAAFKRLSRDDQLRAMGKLANLMEAGGEKRAAERPSESAVVASSTKGERQMPFPASTPSAKRDGSSGAGSGAARSKVAAVKETPTMLTRRVLREATRPLAIDEIVRAVAELDANAPRPEIYSAIYKGRRREEYLMQGDAYVVSPDFYRVRGRKPAS